MHEGKALARSGLSQGYFELSAGSDILEQARNLQIDIIQSGRHIGTFLVKKEQTGGHFSSALEVSDDIQGIPFASLTANGIP